MDSQDSRDNLKDVHDFDVIIIGGGQTGLAAGYFLSKSKLHFIILDGNTSSGDSWRKRWDSLRLFTPGQIDSLPGLSVSLPVNYFPTKDEIADYLDRYALHFELPVKYQQRVESVSQIGEGFEVKTNNSTYFAKNVLICTGAYSRPYIPAFASELNSSTTHLHSSEYCNPDSFSCDSVLIVGAGNSGAEIAIELVQHNKKVWLSGRDVGTVPANSPIGKLFDGKLMWWIMNNLMTIDTPLGRRIKSKIGYHGIPLGRSNRQKIADAGVVLSPRVSTIYQGKPVLENGETMDVDAVIWATGFLPDYDWIKLPAFDSDGYPIQSRGVVEKVPGLYFIGLPFQSGINSSFLGGVSKDAKNIVEKVISQTY